MYHVVLLVSIKFHFHFQYSFKLFHWREKSLSQIKWVFLSIVRVAWFICRLIGHDSLPNVMIFVFNGVCQCSCYSYEILSPLYLRSCKILLIKVLLETDYFSWPAPIVAPVLTEWFTPRHKYIYIYIRRIVLPSKYGIGYFASNFSFYSVKLKTNLCNS